MKKLLTLALLTLLAMQSCTDELPEPDKRKDQKEIYDRVEMEKVRKNGGKLE
ncbi:hypothetical protein [Sphingobacterium sp. 1.A.5]|uniref:hypothetical protein n=1 Tax=Sphingobacterium sp. 1.A.5 TaxID=2044604 RepID=UPI0015D4961E|nr:hypothetical protein [Sphingobacterium sp. 1.A.5]